jgi:hypothetical protein
MVLRPTTKAISLALSLASLVGICFASGAFAQERQLLSLNAPVRAASDPAVQQAVELLSKNTKKAGQSKRGTIFNSQPANDTTVVKYRKDQDKVLILGGSEVIPM